MPPAKSSRSNKSPSPAGLITFVGLRLLSPVVQYGILAHGYGDGLINALGGTVLGSSGLQTSDQALSMDRIAILGMSAIAAFKHVLYATSLTQSRTEVSWALEQSAYNGISDTITSLLFICAQTSPATREPFPQVTLLAGTTLFIVGIGLELGSELQRYFFKQDPVNQGKLYQGGLFGLSRHINYLGFTLWRSGLTIASTGWSFAAVSAVWASLSFLFYSIPSHEEYLSSRYGVQFKEYKKAVPCAYIPFIV